MSVISLSSLIVIFGLFNWSWAATNYCSICSNHSLCLYRNSIPATACGTYTKVPLSQSEITAIVDKHNEWRQWVASGNETRGNPGPQPGSSNMPLMRWDNELARIAQRYADQCVKGHDKCRDVARFHVGQNIATTWGDASAVNPTVVRQMQGWYDEVVLFNRDYVRKFVFDSSYGHYTAIVWANTTFVGCGRARFTVVKTTTQRLICNYGPHGNVIGQAMY